MGRIGSRFSPFYPTSYPITDIGLKLHLENNCKRIELILDWQPLPDCKQMNSIAKFSSVHTYKEN